MTIVKWRELNCPQVRLMYHYAVFFNSERCKKSWIVGDCSVQILDCLLVPTWIYQFVEILALVYRCKNYSRPLIEDDWVFVGKQIFRSSAGEVADFPFLVLALRHWGDDIFWSSWFWLIV